MPSIQGTLIINEGQHSYSVFVRLKGSNSQYRVDSLSSLSQCSGKAGFEQLTWLLLNDFWHTFLQFLSFVIQMQYTLWCSLDFNSAVL